MFRYIAVLLFTLVPTLVSAGSLTLIGAGKPPSGGGGGGGYQGPGDVVAGAKAFWSCRAFSTATKGTKAYRLLRSSDSTQVDINSNASTGLCDTATVTTFCAATTCHFVKIYDQTGANACGGAACDLVPGVNGDTVQSSQLNGVCIAGTNTPYVTSAAVSLNGTSPGYTFVALASRTSTTAFMNLVDDGTNALYYSNSVGVINVFGGTNLGTPGSTFTDPNVFHAFFGVVFNSGTGPGAIVADGAATTGNAGASNVSTAINVGVSFTGFICEAGVWNVGMSSTQYGNLNTNMHSATNGWNF